MILGAILGGALRLIPEALKLFDAKNARTHELEMSKLGIEQIKAQAGIRMAEANAAFRTAELGAMGEAYKEQAATATASYKWVAGVSALVRPSVTWWLLTLYTVAKINAVRFLKAFQGGDALNAIGSTWTAQDHELLASVIGYWFVDRTLAKVKG